MLLLMGLHTESFWSVFPDATQKLRLLTKQKEGCYTPFQGLLKTSQMGKLKLQKEIQTLVIYSL